MRKVIIIIISIFIYFLLTFIYSNILSDKYVDVYVLKNDVYRNSKIDFNNLIKIKVKFNSNINYVTEIKENYIFNNNFSKNTILTKEMISNKENINILNEIISIKIKNIEDSVSYKIIKNNFVSIYFSCKIENIKDNIEMISSDKFINSDNGYITFKLFDKIKVIELCDEYGNNISEENKKIDTIIIDVKKEDVLKINTLKKIGDFSLSLVG